MVLQKLAQTGRAYEEFVRAINKPVWLDTDRPGNSRPSAKFLQALAALLPLLGVERVHDSFAVQFHAGEDLGPEHEAFGVAGHWDGNGPKADAAILTEAARQQGCAVGTERDDTDGGPEAARRAEELA